MQVDIDYRGRPRAVDLEALRARVARVLGLLECHPDCELSLVLCDDPHISQLNQSYLGRSGPTNVLAFPMAEGAEASLQPGLLGDVVVSLDTARREAQQNRLESEEHVARLIIHGILHLLGYDHLSDEQQARRMEELTEDLLEKSAGGGGKE